MKLNNDLVLSSAWIDGEERRGRSTFDVINPSNGHVLASVTESDKDMTELAIVAARKSFYSWKSLMPRERARIMDAWATMIVEHLDDLANILCSENGKVLSEAKNEIAHGASAIRWCAQSSLRIHGDTLPAHSASQRNYTIKQPIGVVGCITPWNFPAAAILVKVSAALATGCTVVVKPSEETPLIALALAKLSKDAGIPAGVFNVLPCGNPNEVGAAICHHPEVNMLSFTGSTFVGKKLYAACGNTVKRVALELGGNAPFIVFEDADIEKAVEGALSARYYNAGQICVGANRFFIHESIYQSFAEQLAQRVSTLSVGDGFDETVQVGPLINIDAKNRLDILIDNAMSNGARMFAGEKEHEKTSIDNLFFQPVVLGDMSPDMQAYNTELFGPIACLYSFSDETEVIRAANATFAGLSAYVYSSNTARLIRLSEVLEAGVIGLNSTNIFSDDLPFGGVKLSGLGREHGLGCLEEFLQTKSICLELQQ